MTKPLYFYNGTTFELVGPTTPQSPIAYQTSAPTAPATGDLWIDSDGDVDTYNRQLTRYYFVATAGQTSVTGTDANGLTLAYVAGSEAVYVNGALQVRGVDYTATNGTSITGLSALGLNDVVEVFAYTAFTVANAYTKTETDSVAAAAPGLRMVVPTSISVGSGSGSANAAGYVSFSGVSSISLNGVFNSTYDNYRINVDISGSTTIGMDFRLRASGTDSTANYSRQYIYGDGTSLSAGRVTSVGAWGAIDVTSSTRGSVAYDIFNPFLARQTLMFGVNASRYPSSTYLAVNGYGHDTTNSYDGISFIPSTGTISGNISVYGYKD